MKSIEVALYKNGEGYKLFSLDENGAETLIQEVNELKTFFDGPDKPCDDHRRIRIIVNEEVESLSSFSQEYLEYKGFDPGDSKESKCPIVHIFTARDYYDYSMRIKRFGKAANIMDSSVWNYCFCSGTEEGPSFEMILRQIYDNWELGIYGLSASHEFADLNARLTKNSYLKGGSHSTDVAPFLFHSEFKVNKVLDKGERFGKYKWRFLLVDDHAYTGLDDDPEKPSKLEIIVSRLKSYGYKVVSCNKDDVWSFTESAEQDYNVAIEAVSSITGMLEALFGERRKKYDIILLDYLLQKSSFSYPIFFILEFFSKLLQEDILNKNTVTSILRKYKPITRWFDINDDSLSIRNTKIVVEYSGLKTWILKGIGPSKRFYFMYISSFVQSIQERLQEQMINISEKYWFISKGACPINTPSLFMYNLEYLMHKRLSTLLPKGNSFDDSQDVSFNDVLKRMFMGTSDEDIDCRGFREKCREEFPYLLNLKAAVNGFRDDLNDSGLAEGPEGSESLFVRSVSSSLIGDNMSLWNHLQHLCYLISYGSDAQWPELWEEYHSISDVCGRDVIPSSLRSFILKLSQKS